VCIRRIHEKVTRCMSEKQTVVVDLVGTLEDDWLQKREWLASRGCAIPIQLSRPEIEELAGRQLLQYLERDLRRAGLTINSHWNVARGWLMAKGVDPGASALDVDAAVAAIGQQMYVQMKNAVGGATTIAENPPIEGAVEAMRRLHERFKLVVLSTRKEEQRAPIERWLQEHFGELVAEVLLVGDQAGTKGESKITWCLRQPVRPFALIDDDKRHFPDEATEVRGILLNLNGRQTVPPVGAVAVTSWREAADVLLRAS
jgi:FMN phosphatase YigB (HAD superfamily)